MKTSCNIPPVPGREHVPLRTKVMWGFGGLADNFILTRWLRLGRWSM